MSWWRRLLLCLILTGETEPRRHDRHAIGERKRKRVLHPKRRNWRHGGRSLGSVLMVLISAVTVSSIVTITSTVSRGILLITFPARLRSIVATLVGLHPATDGL